MLRAVKFFLVVFVLSAAAFVWAETAKTNLTATFKENALKVDGLLFPSHISHQKEGNYAKKAPAVFAKYLTEEDLTVLINYLESPTYKKLHEITSSLDMDLHTAMGKPKGGDDPYAKPSGKKKTKDKGYDAQYCATDLKYAQDDIEKGLSRYKRVCGSDKFPDALDWAQDGKADYDNPFFSRVVPASYAPTSPKWSKKGNTYTYDCGGKKNTFVYDPNSGTFK